MTLYTLCYTFTACVYGYLLGSIVFGNFLDSHERLRNMTRLPKSADGLRRKASLYLADIQIISVGRRASLKYIPPGSSNRVVRLLSNVLKRLLFVK